MTLPAPRLLTLPDSPGLSLTIRARAMLFNDPRSRALLAHVERLARDGGSVLMIGEGGTGKELIARHIHRVDAETRGRSGAFVAANCGGLTETQIHEQLFGRIDGWLARARGGTLFLEGIGALSLTLQAKLLDLLETGAQVRLVAATSIDLNKVVEARRFRADLLERLGPSLVALPPLRERPLDILPLARHFAAVYAAKLDLGEVQFAPEADAALLAYLWPGNIRELENVVHFALVVCADGTVRPEDLELVPGGSLTVPPVPAALAGAFADPAGALRALLRTALDEQPDAKAAAASLGVPLAALKPLLQHLGLLHAQAA